MVSQAILIYALVALFASSAHGCQCSPRTMEELFQNKSVATIALVSNATSLRPFPDIVNQGPITWQLKLKSVYKGDCSLKGKTMEGKSGANNHLCGENPIGGYHIIAFDSENTFSTCLLVRSPEKFSMIDRTEIALHDECNKVDHLGVDHFVPYSDLA